MVTGEWKVLDFGELYEIATADIYPQFERNIGGKTNNNNSSSLRPPSLAQKAKRLSFEISQTLDKLPNYANNLRVLDSNIKKSKSSIVDYDNMLKFQLKRTHSKD